MLKSQFFKLLPNFFIFLGRRVLGGLSTKVSCLEGNHQCGFSSVSAELTPYSCGQKLLFPSQTATCHCPPPNFLLLQWKNYLVAKQFRVIWATWTWKLPIPHPYYTTLNEGGLEFHSLQYKKVSNKNEHWSVEVLVKISERCYNPIAIFSWRRALRCQSGICTCKSRCIISGKVTGFHTCSLGLQELFSILTCQLKSTFSQGCVGHSEGPRAGFWLTSACDGFSSGSRRVVHFCLRSCHLP